MPLDFPNSPAIGATYSPAGVSKSWIYTGEQWSAITAPIEEGASVTVSDTPPGGASAGDLWFDSSSGVTSVYYDGTWVDVGGGDSGTSAGSVNGLLSCDGAGNFSAAVAGTDYLTSASSGSVKAWVITETSATAAAGDSMTIVASFNVSSITKVIGSIYQVNFTNSLSNANYAVLGTMGSSAAGDVQGIAPVVAPVTNYTQGGTQYGISPTANAFRFAAYYTGGSNISYSRLNLAII